jgi:hypothetical protein
MVRAGISEERPDPGGEASFCRAEEVFQAEEAASAKALRQE